MGRSRSYSRDRKKKDKKDKKDKKRSNKYSPSPDNNRKQSVKHKKRSRTPKRSKSRKRDDKNRRSSFSKEREEYYNRRNWTGRGSRRSRSPVKEVEETEEEKKRRKQMRLAKARALLYEKQLDSDEEDKTNLTRQVEKMQEEKNIQIKEEEFKCETHLKKVGKETYIIDSDGLEDSEELDDIPILVKEEDHIANSKKTTENGISIIKSKNTNNSNSNGKQIKQEQNNKNTNGISNGQPKPLPEIDEEEDPFEAYMKTLEKDAVKQEGMNYQTNYNNNQGTGFDDDDEDNVFGHMDKKQIITIDDIMGNNDNNNTYSYGVKIEVKKEAAQQQKKDNNNGAQQQIEEEEEEQNQEGEFDFQKERVKEEQEEEEEDKYYEEFKRQMKQKEIDDKKDNFLIDEEEDGEDAYENVVTKGDQKDDYFKKLEKLNKKKDLQAVDHLAIDYTKFRKNFYIEPQEIKNMTEEEVAAYRKELGDIQVKGHEKLLGKIPRPAKNWYQCGLSELQLQLLIRKKQYLKPFPIQCQCFPIIMSGLDTIGVAETGSGKTMAYILPMLRHIEDQPPLRDGDGPVGLIMVPTRELAQQIYEECKSFAKPMGLKTIAVYGGAGIQGQLSELKKGAEIVICTPARMIDVLTTSNGKITNLKRVTYVVIDEADQMLDQGFEPQIVKIMNNTRTDRQTVMFSATFPKNVEIMAKNMLDKPVEVVVGAKGQACTNIEQIIEVREEISKQLRLLEILGQWNDKGAIIIFVEKKAEADNLFKELLKYGYYSISLHGDMDPEDREFAIYDFKKGVRNILVATSLCARGLDHKSVVLVINYDCPNHLESYIHRIGRTGRAGNKGTAITFITPEQDSYASDLMKALQMSSQKIPQSLNELHKGFIQKVQLGEAKIYQNKNLSGRGFEFNDDESKKIKQTRKELKKRFGMENNLSESEDENEDIFNKNDKKEQKQKEKTIKEKLAMIKDPNLKKQIMDEGIKAAQHQIICGNSQEQIVKAAQNAIEKALNEKKAVLKSVTEGTQLASDLFKEFTREKEEAEGKVSADFEINDYPLNARQRVTGREFIGIQYDNTNCVVTIRGTLIENGKKCPEGQKKQYLHIEGDNKQSVARVHQEIKRTIEEAAQRNLQEGGNRTGARNF